MENSRPRADHTLPHLSPANRRDSTFVDVCLCAGERCARVSCGVVLLACEEVVMFACEVVLLTRQADLFTCNVVLFARQVTVSRY